MAARHAVHSTRSCCLLQTGTRGCAAVCSGMQDRYVLVSHDPAERRVAAPAGLQAAIDAEVAAAGPQVRHTPALCGISSMPHMPPALQARAFVRASGTEDAVRVYAEAGSKAAADSLALRVTQVRLGC